MKRFNMRFFYRRILQLKKNFVISLKFSLRNTENVNYNNYFCKIVGYNAF